MKKPETIKEDKNYKAIDLGAFNQLSKYRFIHPKFSNIDESRLFTGEMLGATGSEISFRELPPKSKIPFLHKHDYHEEIYVILRGSGKFQVDDDVFNIKEGSVVRVSAEGHRTLSNDSGEPLIYIVVQSCADSLKKYNVGDGYRVHGEIKV